MRCMMQSAIAAIGLCIALLSAPQISLAADAVKADSPIESLAVPLAAIFDFRIENGQLAMDRKEWEATAREKQRQAVADRLAYLLRVPDGMQLDEAEKQKRREMAQAVGKHLADMPALSYLFGDVHAAVVNKFKPVDSYIRAATPRDAEEFADPFEGEKISYSARATKLFERMRFAEAKSRRALYYAVEEDSFRLELTDGDDNLIILQQRPESFSVLAIRGNQPVCKSGESFTAFARKHREWFEGEILPALARVGVRPVLPSDALPVRETALQVLENSSDVDPDPEELLRELESDDRETRQKAHGALVSFYEQCEELIDERLQSNDLSPELQAALDKVIVAQRPSKLPRQTIVAFELLNDPEFLVSLFDVAIERDIPNISRQLEKITGQQLGANPEKWKAFVRKRDS
jgi:hypothetical protein